MTKGREIAERGLPCPDRMHTCSMNVTGPWKGEKTHITECPWRLRPAIAAAIDLAIKEARREERDRLKKEFNATLVLIRCLSPPQKIDDFIADQQKRIRALSEKEESRG